MSSTYTDSNNIGAQFNGQGVNQHHLPGGVCELSDFTAGCLFVPVAVVGDVAIANAALIYNHRQLFLRLKDAGTTEGRQAADGRYEITMDYDIVGGTGKSAGADGELTSATIGWVLAAPTPYGSFGQFGSFQETHTGTVTY